MEKPRDIFTLIKDSWKLFKDNFLLFSKIILVVQVPISIVSFIFTSYYLIYLKDNYLTSFTTSQNDLFNLIEKLKSPLVFIPSIILFVIFILLIIYFTTLSNIALIFAVSKKISNEEVDLKNSYKEAFPLFWSYVWISILVGLAVLGGLILLLIPGIIFAVWFAFVGFVLVLERLKGRKALKRSRELVKGYFWYVLGYTILIYLLVASINWVINIPLSLLSSGIFYINAGSVSLVTANFISGIYGLVTQIVGILGICAFILLFSDLRSIKDKS